MQRNAVLAKQIYPGWEVYVFCATDVPSETKSELKKLGCTVLGPVNGISNPMLWRFCVPVCGRFIVRDADSRLNVREKAAVDEWIGSGKRFHIMRDHPHHNVVMNGGMWGSMNYAGMVGEIAQWGKDSPSYTNDQAFLEQAIWPEAKMSCLQHDTFSCKHFPGAKPFPKHGGDRFRFVGEVFEADEKPRHSDWEMRFEEIWK